MGSRADPSEETRRRLVASSRLVASCRLPFGGEIAVTGSVARGTADEYSDVEVNLWVEELPDPADICAWLEGAGATDVTPSSPWLPDPTGFHWIVCRYEGIWFELGWSTIREFEAFVEQLSKGAFVDHLRLQIGRTIQEAVALRSDGLLAAWKHTLGTYPAGLAARIVADQTRVWSDPHVPGVRWALAMRGQRFALALRFTWDAQNLFRVLFAVNEVWDRDLKWTDEHSLDLRLRPDDLSARIDTAFRLDDLVAAVEAEQRLIIDVLELAATRGFAVENALASMQNGLAAGLT